MPTTVFTTAPLAGTPELSTSLGFGLAPRRKDWKDYAVSLLFCDFISIKGYISNFPMLLLLQIPHLVGLEIRDLSFVDFDAEDPGSFQQKAKLTRFLVHGISIRDLMALLGRTTATFDLTQSSLLGPPINSWGPMSLEV